MIEPRLGLPWWHPASLTATGFGIGLLPLMPGSWGSLAALPCAWAIRGLGGVTALAAAAAIAGHFVDVRNWAQIEQTVGASN